MTRVLRVIEKDPDEFLDYGFDFTLWLAEVGDSIASVEWDVPSGLTEEEEIEPAAGIRGIFLSGGTIGDEHVVTCTATTDNDPARVIKRSILLRIVDRGA